MQEKMHLKYSSGLKWWDDRELLSISKTYPGTGDRFLAAETSLDHFDGSWNATYETGFTRHQFPFRVINLFSAPSPRGNCGHIHSARLYTRPRARLRSNRSPTTTKTPLCFPLDSTSTCEPLSPVSIYPQVEHLPERSYPMKTCSYAWEDRGMRILGIVWIRWISSLFFLLDIEIRGIVSILCVRNIDRRFVRKSNLQNWRYYKYLIFQVYRGLRKKR